MPAPFQLSKSNRSDKAPGSAPGTPRTREESLTFSESLARIENKVGRLKASFFFFFFPLLLRIYMGKKFPLVFLILLPACSMYLTIHFRSLSEHFRGLFIYFDLWFGFSPTLLKKWVFGR